MKKPRLIGVRISEKQDLELKALGKQGANERGRVPSDQDLIREAIDCYVAYKKGKMVEGFVDLSVLQEDVSSLRHELIDLVAFVRNLRQKIDAPTKAQPSYYPGE